MNESGPAIVGIRLENLKPEVRSYVQKLRASLQIVYDRYEVANRDELAAKVRKGEVGQEDTDKAIELLRAINDYGRKNDLPEEIKHVQEAYYAPRNIRSMEYKTNYRAVDGWEWEGKGICAIQSLPDGRIVTGDQEGEIRMWEKSDDGWQAERVGRHGGIFVALHALDDRIISGGGDSKIRIWKKIDDQWQESETMDAQGKVRFVQALPDGRIVQYGLDHALSIWKKSDGEWTRTMLGEFNNRGIDIRISPDGKIYAGHTRTMDVFSEQDGIWKRESLKPTKADINAFWPISDGRILLSTAGGTLGIYSKRADGKWDHEHVAGGINLMEDVQYLPDGRILLNVNPTIGPIIFEKRKRRWVKTEGIEDRGHMIGVFQPLEDGRIVTGGIVSPQQGWSQSFSGINLHEMHNSVRIWDGEPLQPKS